MNEKINLLKLIGFHRTLEILSITGRAITLRSFYERLLKKGEKGKYYNAFYRIKETLITKGVIEVFYEKTNKTKRIRLTRKGITVKQALEAIMELIG